MQASSPPYLKCYQCRKSPKQFTFLLCNHIICGKCISKNVEIGEKYNIVRCSCGCETFFNQDFQEISENSIFGKEVGVAQKQQQIQPKTSTKNSNYRKSHTDQNNKTKQSINQTLSRTLINERSSMPMLEVSQVFSLQRNESSQQKDRFNRPLSPNKQRYLNVSMLTSQLRQKLSGTQKTKYDQSLLLGDYPYDTSIRKDRNIPNTNNTNINNRVINQFSTHQVGKDNIVQSTKHNSPTMISLKQVKNINQSIIIPSAKPKLEQKKQRKSFPQKENTTVLYHGQFQNQIDFLRILFEKDLQQVQLCFAKVVEEFKVTYQKLEQELRALYIEEILTKETMLRLKLSDLIKNKYEKTLGNRFKLLKNQLYSSFYQHNQNIVKSIHSHDNDKLHIQSPLLNAYKSHFPSMLHNNSLDNSQAMSESDFQCDVAEAKSVKTKQVPQFYETVEQKLDRLTTKQARKSASKNYANELNKISQQFSPSSGKRIQTQNIHTSIKRPRSLKNIKNLDSKQLSFQQQPQNANHTFYNPDYQQRLTQKPHKRQSHHLPKQNPDDKLRRQIIYFSPPVPFCYKHFQKRERQAKNYISYIDKLCHQQKMKNHQELFKKVKQLGSYQFGRPAKH